MKPKLVIGREKNQQNLKTSNKTDKKKKKKDTNHQYQE